MYAFNDIAGNENVKRNLREAIKNNTASHAYIFSGGEGLGKKLAANTFAKALQCSGEGERPCGVCDSCRVFDSKNHPDVFYVVPTKTKAISIDDIREQVIEQVSIKQYKYRYKIFIIDKADTMTPQAQNAFLKTLEEPPEYAVFLLLASNLDAFLPTVLSRCVVLKLRQVSTEAVKTYLVKELGVGDNEAALYAEYAQGSIGKAIQAASSEEFAKMREDTVNWVVSLEKKDIVSVMSMAKEMEVYKERPDFLDIMYLWYRDVFAMKKLKDKKYLIQKDKEAQITAQAQSVTYEGLSKKLDAVWQAKRQLALNGNFQLAMEVMLLHLKES